MTAYFDTSVLIKFYADEENSAAADALRAQISGPILFTHLHAIEVRTGLRLKRGRGEITQMELESALSDLQEDIDAGVIKKPAYEISAVFNRAEELSAKYAAITLVRSMDILHVAAAVVIGVERFITFDSRQAALALKAGLKVNK